MAYKSIFSALSEPTVVEDTLAQGLALAAAQDAHFDVLSLGVDRSQTGYYYAGANAMVLQETIARANQDAEAMEAMVKDKLKGSDARWASEAAVAQIADVGRAVAARARFADLAVLPKPYIKGGGVEMEAIVEGALFDGKTPVLVVPGGVPPVVAPQRVVVAWNESNEALVAIRAAMPFLEQADVVHVVVIDPPTHGPNRSDPGGMVSQFISRHGARVEIDVLSRSMPRISDVLLRHVRDIDAHMVVMGAYGHSRFREAILGGATRNMLEQATVPVFMAH